MKKKICPICDTDLNGGNYCRLCKRIVFHPKVVEQNYYLNEKRSGAASGSRPDAGPAPAPAPAKPAGLPDYDGKKKTQPVYHPASKSSGASGRKKTPMLAKVVLAVFLFGIAANFLTVLMGVVARNVLVDRTYFEYSQNEPLLEEEDGDFGYEAYDLDPEKLREEGSSCSFYSHVDMDEGTAAMLAETFLTGHGVNEFSIEREDYNKRYVYDDGTESTIYDTCVTYLSPENPEGEAEEFFSISVGSDTGSGQLHYFQLEASDIGFAAEAAAVFSEAVDQLDGSVSAEPSEIRTGILDLQNANPENYEDDFSLYGDNWSVYGYKEADDFYSVYVESGEPYIDDEEYGDYT